MISLRKSLISRIAARGSGAHLRRGFSGSALVREIQVFDMPSMSPTMEEGGIVEWNFKPGDKFSAGDVLLEIETDKAQISVEAGDDGILTKILVEAGAKGIPVGQPIAVTAEEGDDIASIDYDALLKDKRGVSSDSKADQAAATESSSPAPAPTPASHTASEPSQGSTTEAAPAEKPSKPIHGKHGLGPLPAALRLMHENSLSEKDVKGSGPFGRITKGDVLAFLGKIPKGYPENEQARFEKMEKMDLSNVQPAAPKEVPSAETSTKAAAPEKPKPLVTKVSIPLSTRDLAAKVPAAQKSALRQALLSLKPKPSILRDPTLDFLTAPARPPFQIKSSEVVVRRAKPVSLEVSIQEPPAAKPSKAVEVYIESLRAQLAPEKST